MTRRSRLPPAARDPKTAGWRQFLALSATAAAADRVKDLFSWPEVRADPSRIQTAFAPATGRLYPGEFSCFSQDSAKEMVEWTITIEASGMPLRSARLAAKEFGFKLD